MVLTQLDNPVVSYKADELEKLTEGHIAQALMVCRDGFNDKLRSVLRFTNSNLVSALVAWRMCRYGLNAAGLDFLDYLAAYRESPDYWQGQDDKFSRIQGPFRVAGTLLTHTSMSEARVWDMPLSLACCYQACVAEDNGAKLIDAAELAKADKGIQDFRIDDGTGSKS